MRHSRLLVWRRPRNERWNNICVFVLHKLGLYCVTARISSCERLWIRLLLNLRQRTEIGAVVSTCDCCGKRGHDKSKCQMRDAKCTICGKLDKSRRCADNARKLTVKRIRQAISIREPTQASPSPPMCSHISSVMVSSHAALRCQLWNQHCASFTKKKNRKSSRRVPTNTNQQSRSRVTVLDDTWCIWVW